MTVLQKWNSSTAITSNENAARFDTSHCIRLGQKEKGQNYKMKRNIEKTIKEYKRKFGGTNKGQIYASDLWQLKAISDGENYSLACNAMMAGIMVGYRLGKKRISGRPGYQIG